MTRARGALALLAVYTGLALVFTYPLVAFFGTHYPGEAGGDAKIYLWNYWWVREAVTSGTNPFATDAIFYPVGIGLSLHTLGFLQGLVLTPLSALLGDVRAVNVLVLWTFVASALATFALARHLGASSWGAFAAGIVFAFCPYRLARLSGHYDLLGTEWIPLYALVLLKVASTPRFSPGLVVLGGAVAAACGYTASTYLVFLALLTLLFLAVNARRFRDLAPRFAAMALGAAALLAPLLVQMWRDLSQWSYPPYPGADRYAADLFGYLRRGALGDNVTETSVFAGYAVVAVAAAALWLRKQRPALSFWLLAAGVFYVLSLGESLHIGGADTGLPLPFALLSKLPLLEQLRAPSRFSVMVMLALAVLLALVVSEWRPRTVLALAALVAFEYVAVPVPVFAAERDPLYARLAAERDGTTVAEIPGIEQSPGEIMLHQTVHHHPVFIGTAARVPTEKADYYFGLPLVRPLIDLRKGKIALSQELLDSERRSAPAVARFLGLGYLVVDEAYAKRGVLDFAEAVLPTERYFEDGRRVVLRVKRASLPSDPAVLDVASPESRQHFESGWLRPEREEDFAFRWSNRRRATILFRRPEGATSIALELSPLQGLAVVVEARVDGRALGRHPLAPGWQTLRLELPRPAGGVERLSLAWSELGRASPGDPRSLAARVRAVTFGSASRAQARAQSSGAGSTSVSSSICGASEGATPGRGGAFGGAPRNVGSRSSSTWTSSEGSGGAWGDFFSGMCGEYRSEVPGELPRVPDERAGEPAGGSTGRRNPLS